MRRTAVLAITLTAALLAGCGGDGGDDGDTGSSPVAATTSAPAEGAGAKLSAAQVKAALPTVADLPGGWSAEAYDGSDDSDVKFEPEECDALLNNIGETDDETLHEAGATFARGGDLGTELTVEVGTNSTTVPAEMFTKVFDHTLKTCSETSAKFDGVPAKVRLSEQEFPEIGDLTQAIRMDVEIMGLEMTGDVVFIGVGHNALVVSAVGFTRVESSELEQVVRTAYAKLEKAAVDAGTPALPTAGGS